MIKQETIERVRAETDIVELVGSYLPLKKVGRHYRGLCPFHPDRSPSFYVSQERQTYHCFGCGAGGNAFGFVMALEKQAFPDAVRFLANRLGIEVVEERTSRNKLVYDACEQGAQFFERQLRRSESARRYLARRELKDETAKRFRLGFAPGGNRLLGEARRRSWSETALVRAGLLAERGGGLADYFYDRIVFPITSLSGKVIGFAGRVLGDREPKYLNSPDTEIFRKGYNLYGAYQARPFLRDEPPILVEGNFDVLALVDRGIPNTVAPLGTALTANQALLLRRYSHRVLLCFDGDDAGSKAARRAAETLLKCGMEPEMVVLPRGSDPDTFVRKSGRDGFTALVNRRQGLIDFLLAGRKMRGVADERAALREVVGLLRAASDEAARELYVNHLAERFGLDKDVLLQELSDAGPARPARSGPEPIEERLVAAAANSQELARTAKELGFAQVLSDARLQTVAGLIAESCDEPGYGPALLLDRIEDDDTRRLVAGWTFLARSVPEPDEFASRVLRMRAARLQARIVAAHDKGNEQEASELVRQRSELLREAARERSSRR